MQRSNYQGSPGKQGVKSKNMPTSGIPRFYPHPPQEPPKEREPERVVYSPFKNLYKKKKKDEEEKEDFTKYNLEDLLLDQNIEFRNPEKVTGGWLPLEAYDDREYDARKGGDWLKESSENVAKGEGKWVGGQGLWKDKDGLCYWRKVRITKFLPKSERYEGYWENTKEKCRLYRVHLRFDSEDPRIFVKRFKAAYNARIHADSLIKYNYYVENMPIHQIPEIDNEQVNRMLGMTQNTKSLRGKSSADTTTLLSEVNFDFAKTMNKIIFDKHLNEKGNELITGNLQLPPKPPKKLPPFMGMISIPPHNFPAKFSEFCHESLNNKHEVVRALQEIKKECDDVRTKDIFSPNITNTMRIEEFQQTQGSSITQTSFYLKETWVTKIRDIIKGQFQNSDHAWFNLNETSKDIYEMGKLKKFLTQVRFMMENTLLYMTQDSVKRFTEILLEFVPENIVVKDSYTVENTFNQAFLDSREGGKAPPPLFNIDLMLFDEAGEEEGSKISKPGFSTSPRDIIRVILLIFDNGIKSLQEITQIEQKLLGHLFKNNQKMFLKATERPIEEPEKVDPENPRDMPDENQWAWDEYNRLEEALERAIYPLNEFLHTFDNYEEEYKLDVEKYIKKQADEDAYVETEDLRKDIYFHRSEVQRIKSEILDSVVVSMFQVQTSEIRTNLADKHVRIANQEIEIIAKRAKAQADEILKIFVEMNAKIEKKPVDIEDLTAIKEYMATVPNELEKIQVDINATLDTYKILEEFQYKFPEQDDYDKQWTLFGSPKETLEKIEKQTVLLNSKKDAFIREMMSEQTEFKGEIQDIEKLVYSFQQYADINDYEDVAEKSRELQSRLQAALAKAKTFNHREVLVEAADTDYTDLGNMNKEFQPYYNMWTTIDLWRKSHKSWLEDGFEELDAARMEEIVDNSNKTLAQAMRIFRDKELTPILKIANVVKDDVEAFKPFVPLALGLRTEGMKERHWDAITAKCGFEVRPYEGFTFQHCIDMFKGDLAKYSEICVDFGEKAGKEYQIECSLEKMQSDWKTVEFRLIPFKTTGTFSVVGFDDAMAMLDEHIVITQTMQFSPFKKPFEEEIENWNATLLNVVETIDEWIKCQGSWMYLQPIFDSPDIMKQLHYENKKFRGVDKMWRKIIDRTKENPNVLIACNREGLLKDFQDGNNNLELVQRGLNEYLGQKRAVFARFYFLSDNELLEILSQTKEVENVRPHLRKVFESMADLEFHEDKTIHAMFSAENEKIEFAAIVDPNNKGVEHWMGEVEDSMVTNVRRVLLHSVDTYKDGLRTEWIKSHPGQCVLNGSQVHWTAEVESGMKEGVAGVEKYSDFCHAQLADTVSLVRQRLTKLQSITLGALIVIDVHARDVVDKLKAAKISDPNAFEWISQMRYYWEDDNCRVKCIQTNFPYGYEYLGNTLRLVITPLTDKCYMTLMGALKLNLGGAPAGPAGTGKTESTKDLAKALAKQCVVFNCSDGMDYLMVGKFFKGLASAGAWACFDEFNRINIEVLSVIAQQLLHLFGCKAQGIKETEFEESHISIQDTFSVFITMNPGYAGRTELPDNLKALFRPVAMMVPNYALIGEIMLYSFGFHHGAILATKMVTTFTLSSEQLSSQTHYDYGMRAVRSVINAAGLLKRQTPDMNEDQLLLRALRDVNVPKFLKDDLPLFENIISDLFPGVEKPQIDYGKLLDEIKNSLNEMNLQPHPIFIEKIIQLYDTIQVRHGLMIVGPTGGGKTSNYKALAKACSKLHGTENFQKVHYHILNPKSITMGQLYGEVDPQTTEWINGVLAVQIVNCTRDTTQERHWVMFDGPVDAIWIENMNTVLDDNKKLCLNSGQIITLTEQMTMMFEVEDLEVASPATVSRCGMVYMEPVALGLEPVITSWLNTIPPAFKAKKGFSKLLGDLINKYVHAAIKFMKKNCPEPVPTMDNNTCSSMMRILDCYFADYFDTEIKKTTPEEVEKMEQMLEPHVIFALIWSVGCTTTQEGRGKFDRKVRELMSSENKFRFPEGSVYDFCWDKNKDEWVNWKETVSAFSVDSKLQYQEIVVPTFDSIRMKYIKKLLIQQKKHILCPGPTGTGKTINITQLVTQELSEDYQTIPITFSAQTSANQTQNALDEKFDKRRKGIYGPPTGKRFIIFVDDLNMPKKETYGAQPPIELLRQWMDHQGWYDLKQKDKPFMKIEDIIFVCAMGPPGGGRSALTKRLERHFNIMTYTNLDKDSITMIFSTILKSFIGPFSEDIANSIAPIVESTQKVYNQIAEKLKPTPTKSHYTFNLRDISKVFGGICSADKKQTSQTLDVVRLWIHENKRVFGDRMISNEDRATLDQMLHDEATGTFKLDLKDIYITERIFFGDYMNGIDMEGRPYQLITDLKVMQSKIEEYLDDQNAGSKHPMLLVMFLDACDHVNRVCRVLRQPQGNALLLGVGGSGRQSLSRLAAYISNQKTYQIEVVKGYSMTNWRDNLKTCLIMAGCENKPTMFLFCDTQIINEQMLEDINNVLNSGDVPGLYKNEDFEEIYKVGKAECSKKGLPINKMNMFSCYLGRVKQNIHIVLAMSPLGDIFRSRLLKFPSLVNCCTLDWFTEWPEEALRNVAKGSFNDESVNLGDSTDNCVEMFKSIHQSVEQISVRFLNELRRRNYVTPTSYLELLSTYKKILNERQKYYKDAKARLERGLNVLLEASVEVANLQDSLEKKKPQLKETQIQVEKTKVIIERDTKEADATKVIVAAEEAEAAEQEAEVAKVKNDADQDLAVALPMLEEAIKKVKNMQVQDLVELKAVNTPSMTIVKIFEMVYFMLKDEKGLSKPKKPNDPKKKEYDPDGYFDLAKREILNNPKGFLSDMVDYKRDDIQEPLVLKINPMLEREEVAEAKVQTASKALLPVRIWIASMMKYSEVLKVVNPKKAIAAEMTAKLEIVQKQLNEKRESVRQINEKLAALNANMQEQVNLQNKLNQEIIDCGLKLVRAEKLIGGLQGEKDRWTETVKMLGEKQNLLIGDCLVATGMVSYAGPFTSEYRADLEASWREKLTKLGVPHTEGVTMKDVIGDPITIRTWNVAGLPNDQLSVENGIILFKARRWPLMIDPQTQANKFIKKLGESVETGCEVFKLSESNLLRNLELAIQFGKWVLLENIGEELDPALEPILLQQKIKQGSGYVIKIGEKNIIYNETFRFFMTTTLPNPHYSPETSVKVTILNFAITPQGLEDQMLNQFVGLEMPELQEKKDECVQENAKAAVIMRDIEDRILEGLTKHENIAAILETDELIDILSESKKTSDEITERMKESEITEKEIDATRESFRSVAFRASLLFFCIVDLANIDPMYQYSLQWFQLLFGKSVKNSQPSTEVDARIRILNNYQTLSLYQNVCRSLFEKDKLLFSFLLTVKILFGDKAIDPEEWRFFLAGPSGTIDILPNPTDWLDELEWGQMYKQLHIMDKLPAFKGIENYFIEYNKKFKKVFDATEAHLEPLPGEWNEKMNSFQKMIILKAVRSDKITQAIQNFIIEKMGQQFVEPPTFDLGACYNDSSHLTPLIFVLSAGSDPVADFKKFAEESQMSARLDMISLGQGQAGKAERMISEMQSKGGWVLLQNCHLAESWMGRLEHIVEQLNDEINPDFRMWMTSMPSKKFPVSVLQNSIKMTLEPPTGLKANLSRTYAILDNRTLNDCEKPNEFKKILFGFAFFHAIVQDRRKFGPIGWNIPYAFTFEDFDVCFKQLRLFLDEYEQIPYVVLNFLGSEINYGGRVTDDKDVRLIKNILARFIQPEMLDEGFKYSESGIYKTIPPGSQEDYLKYIKEELPLNPHPEAFGLHENAEITTNMDGTRRILEQVLSIQPRSSSGGGKNREEIIMDIAIEMQSKTPPVFDLEAIQEKYPTEYTESMNTVLTQEVIRYNRLLSIMAVNLKNLQRAVKGEVVMSEDLEKVANSMFDNQVPVLWANKGFLSLKPLASWIQDLNTRVDFIKGWIEGGTPKVFWISGFFFPQAFFTGTLQNYARKHVIAINELKFESKIYDDITYQEVTEKPEDGCYIYGMYLEGARWNSTTHMLDDSKPKKLYTELPMAWFYPKRNRVQPETGIYNCPVYKVLSRTGTLSTTGHSTNYVLMMELPSDKKEQKWIMAGVALFLSLRY